MKNLGNYIPEPHFWQDKRENGKIFREDCAIFDVNDRHRILASRGDGLTVGKSFFRLFGVSRAEVIFAKRSFGTHPYALVRGKDGAILLFGGLLERTGILLAFPLHEDPARIARAILLAQKSKEVALPNVVPSSCDHADEALFYRMSELFLRIDRAFSRNTDINLLTQTLLLGEFAGCRPKVDVFPTDIPPLAPTDKDRLAAFLLCAFLTFRQMNGCTRAMGEKEDETAPIFRCCVKWSAEGDLCEVPTRRDLFFLSSAVFRDFSATVSENALFLEAALRIRVDSPFSVRQSDTAPSFFLSWVFEEAIG